jgi:hypothetical protein
VTRIWSGTRFAIALSGVRLQEDLQMQFQRVSKGLIIILVLALFSAGAAIAGKIQQKDATLQFNRRFEFQQVTPIPKLNLPPGPMTGRFYLAGAATAGFDNGVHNLGVIKKGQKITIFVEGLTTGSDLTVLITAPNWAKNDLIVWQADDNGNDPDPAFSITAPVTGVYTMLVADFNQKPGWYRFRMELD